MRLPEALSLLVGLLAPVARAADAEYMTDLAPYTLLAPCVQDALTYAINAQKYSASCGEAQDELQSCICSNTGLLDVVSSSVSSDVNQGCHVVGDSDDQRSASQMLDQYCDPDIDVHFSTPTDNNVNAYITDLSQMAWLPPCASGGLSAAVMQESMSRCPEAANLFAPCVCKKDNVVKSVSRTISLYVRSSCSNDEDVTSAYGFYNEYCAMNDGTTSFATPAAPSGDMSYYITALPVYKSLSKCARSGVSAAVFDQTYSFCGTGPGALASCVCLKSGMRSKVSYTMTSGVKGHCDVTATDAVSAALDVLDLYCSAAAGEAKPVVTESVTEEYPAAESGTGPGGSGPQETGGANGGGGGDSGSGDGDGDDSSSSGEGKDGGGGGGGGSNKTATIAASVLGGAVAVALVAGIVIFIRRRKKKAAAAAAAAAAADQPPPVEPYLGHPELHGGDSRTDLVKLGPDGHALTVAEMPHQPRTPELQPYSEADRYVPYHQAQELASTAGPTTQVNTVSPMSAGQQEMRWHSGPVESYEMDSTSRRT